MKKFILLIGIVIVSTLAVFCYKTFMTPASSQYQTVNSTSKKNTDDVNETKEKSNTDNKITSSTDDTYNNKEGAKNSSTSNIDVDGYSIKVKSPLYNAVVSLDEKSKEIKIKVLDDQSLDNYNTDKYVNLSSEDIDFLKSNADSLMKDFENGNLMDKYNIATKMLKEYDTNINMGDLINLAVTYLK